MEPKPVRYTLGIDLGVGSVGWAVVELDDDGRPSALLRAGVRIFAPGVEPAVNLAVGDAIARGLDRSRAVARRQARLQRRLTRRRAARRRDVFILLAQAGLLPGFGSGAYAAPVTRHEILQNLDRELLAANRGRGTAVATAHLLPYFLRARAISEPLQPFELGRALYHLAQRRGFKSSRKGPRAQGDEDLGKVKQGISQLAAEMSAAGAPTLGAYLSGLDPRRDRVRRRFTERGMFEREFDRIWRAQQGHHPALTAQLRQRLERLLFDQRPIARQEHLVGWCDLEPAERRAPWASLAADRFRVLQKVNDLRIEAWPESRPLSGEQRRAILDRLADGDVTLPALKRVLGLNRGKALNLERSAKVLRGERVAPMMRLAFGAERWAGMGEDEKDRIVATWRDEDGPEALRRIATTEWGLSPEAAERLLEEPSQGYCALSAKAIKKLLPEMEAGASFKSAELKVYGTRAAVGAKGVDRLPPVLKSLSVIRNPAVHRSLTELRKVVNGLIREFGKPWSVRVELARDLKRTREGRARLHELMGERHSERRTAEARLREELGMAAPSRDDVDKLLLAEECGYQCPYTGRQFSLTDMFAGQVDIEHILPLSIYADDSFANKTLAWREVNEAKGQRTPYQAFAGSEYEAILARVARWPRRSREKLRRFSLKTSEEIAEFTSSHLNDTRYASRLARRYLMQLYGEPEIRRADGTHRDPVAATSGAVTATLRRHWQLEQILGGAEAHGKQRDDHRHHAVDALVIACTSQSTIQAMSVAAAEGLRRGEAGIRAARRVESPWRGFVDSVRPAILSAIVSHRPEHRLRGQLHADTIMSPPYRDGDKWFTVYRKPVNALSAKELGAGDEGGILDAAVRAAVQAKLAEHGWDGAAANLAAAQRKLVRSDPGSLPQVGGVPVWSVRLRKPAGAVVPIADGSRRRHAEPAAIHHVELFAAENAKGRTVWLSKVVTLLEAYDRRRAGEPVVSRSCPDRPGGEFLFSLMKDDTLELNVGGAREIVRVKKFGSNGQIWFVPVNNAQKDSDQKKTHAAWSLKPSTLAATAPRKVGITPGGEVRDARD